MKVITSRFWKKCDAPYCILLSNKKVIGSVDNWYLCGEHMTEARVEELDQWYAA